MQSQSLQQLQQPTAPLRPKNVRDVVMGTHFEITAPVSGKVIARALPQI
jgi:hypothetical protein